jgi:cyclophilin family peptidyl-prolyl cis-trans isomerase
MMKNFIELKTKYGITIIQMFPEIAPKHCKIISSLVEGGFYNGLKFHRVIKDTIVQTGCPFGNGFGGVNVNIPIEINSKIKHVVGACSMARSNRINSASSQFFICLKDLPNLDNFYSVWGQVIEGLDYLYNIKEGDPEKKGLVEKDPDRIYYMKLIDYD